MSERRWPVTLLTSIPLVMAATGSVHAQERPDPMIAAAGMQAVSQHVYLIPDNNVGLVPNVGIVVGTRATLVIDTGLGDENGEIVVEAVRSVHRGAKTYVAATHFHPEHDLGAGAFPEEAVVIRSTDQQADVEEFGLDLAERFAGFSPRNAELLEGVTIRPADLLFDDMMTLDLGGVTVQISEIGPTHTRGDMTFFVVEDRVLLSGDVVMAAFPAFNSAYSSVARWVDAMDELEATDPDLVIPSHGRTGAVELIRDYRAYLLALQARARELRGEGLSADEAIEALVPEFESAFSQWRPSGNRVGSAVRAAYRELDTAR